jgi:hypothetical protein
VRRALAAVVALGLIGLWLPRAESHLPPRPGRPCPGETDAVQTSGQWETIKAPLESLTGHAAGGIDGKRVLATDGHVIKRSGDGGCTWSDSYDAGVLDVEAVAFPGGGERAYAVLSGVARSAAGRLLVSDDGGAHWRSTGAGLPAVGGFRELAGYGDQLYLTTDIAGLDGSLYASSDGGTHWARVGGGSPILSVAVDPLDARTLYVVRTDHSVERSDDGGATFAALTLPSTADINLDDPGAPDRDHSWREVVVAHTKHREAVVVVAAAPSAAASVTRIAASNDSGKSFRDLPTDGLGPIGGLGFGNSPAQILFAAGSDSTAFRGAGLLAFDLGEQEWRDVDDLELGSLREPSGVHLSVALRGHADYDDVELRRDAAGQPDLIARYTPPDPPPGDPGLLEKGPCGEGLGTRRAPEEAARVSFAPGQLELGLEPDQPERVPLAASLRPIPTPLDVYFVIDSSESMDPAIDGVKCSAKRIVRQLRERGIDAWFGVGTYNDRYDTRYEQREDLAPPGPPLVDALEHLFTRRGKEEPIRTALYQTATGAGLKTEDSNGIGGTLTTTVPPGQGASYRKGALHTAIVIGDEPYEDTTPGEPAVPDIIKALKAKDILALGVQVVPPFFQPLQTRDDGRLIHRQLVLRRQLETFARGSGAVAPPGGVDCDGGGSPDIAAGQPLVCSAREEGIQQSMSDTLVALLANLQDRGDVRLVPRETSGMSVSVEGGTETGVDLKRASQLAGTAVVACSADQAGKRLPLSFAVKVGTRTVGTLAGAARCGRVTPTAGSVPKPRSAPAHKPAPAPVKPAVAVQASAPAVPPAPAQAPQPAVAVPPPAPPVPAPVPASPVTSAAQAQAAASAPQAAPGTAPAPGAMAAAPETAPLPQTATAKVTTDDHAMVAASLTLGIGICGGFGFLVVAADRRRRPVPERSEVREHRR